MIVIKNILVATDFSEPSVVALAYGRDLARSYQATLHVLHVVEDVMMRYGTEFGVVSPNLQQELEEGGTPSARRHHHRGRPQHRVGRDRGANQPHRRQRHHRICPPTRRST